MHNGDIKHLAGTDAYWALKALDRIQRASASDVGEFVVVTLADDAGRQLAEPTPTIVLDADEVAEVVGRRRHKLQERLQQLSLSKGRRQA